MYTQLLLDCGGSEFDLVTQNEESVLHLAAQQGLAQCCRRLLDLRGVVLPG